MSWLQFFASVIGSLSWPIAIITIVILLRKPISHVIESLRKLSVRGMEATFGEAVAELTAEADQVNIAEGKTPADSFDVEIASLAAINPAAAVVRAWLEIEEAINKAAGQVGYGVNRANSFPLRDIRYLRDEGYIDRETYRILIDLSVLRNNVVSGSESASKLTYAEAMDYARLAKRMAQRLLAIDLK